MNDQLHSTPTKTLPSVDADYIEIRFDHTWLFSVWLPTYKYQRKGKPLLERDENEHPFAG